MPGHIIITGKSLSVIANGGDTATTRPDPDDTTFAAEGRAQRVIVGKPVTVRGVEVRKFTRGVSADMFARYIAETDPAKRAAMLTNVSGKLSKSGRVQVREDQYLAYQEALLAATTDDDGATNARAAYAMHRALLEAGTFVIPAVDGTDDDGTDPLAAAFGIADADTDDDDDDEPAKSK